MSRKLTFLFVSSISLRFCSNFRNNDYDTFTLANIAKYIFIPYTLKRQHSSKRYCNTCCKEYHRPAVHLLYETVKGHLLFNDSKCPFLQVFQLLCINVKRSILFGHRLVCSSLCSTRSVLNFCLLCLWSVRMSIP